MVDLRPGGRAVAVGVVQVLVASIGELEARHLAGEDGQPGQSAGVHTATAGPESAGDQIQLPDARRRVPAIRQLLRVTGLVSSAAGGSARRVHTVDAAV